MVEWLSGKKRAPADIPSGLFNFIADAITWLQELPELLLVLPQGLLSLSSLLFWLSLLS